MDLERLQPRSGATTPATVLNVSLLVQQTLGLLACAITRFRIFKHNKMKVFVRKRWLESIDKGHGRKGTKCESAKARKRNSAIAAQHNSAMKWQRRSARTEARVLIQCIWRDGDIAAALTPQRRRKRYPKKRPCPLFLIHCQLLYRLSSIYVNCSRQ